MAAFSSRIRAMAHALALGLVAGLSTGLAACAPIIQDMPDGTQVVNDPFEDVNRVTFALNEGLDEVVLRPVSIGYRAVVPAGGRTAIRNALRNMRSPLIITNQLLQGDLDGAGDATYRFLVNSTVGFFGFFDPAGADGVLYQDEDFGQTLAVWGMPDGPYLMLPLLGPSGPRDIIGLAAEQYGDPMSIYLRGTNNEDWDYLRSGLRVIGSRELSIEEIDDVRKTAVDGYAAFRAIYVQRRNAQISDNAVTADIPDYDDPSDDQDLSESVAGTPTGTNPPAAGSSSSAGRSRAPN